MMKQFRTAIVGVGFIGAVHIEALRRLGSVSVVALCNNVHCQDIAQKMYIPGAYDDYKKMIDNENLDFVHICTPNNTHFEIACYALTHGVNVVCEKPLAISVEQARQLAQLAKENDRISAVNFHTRCYPMLRQMKSMVQAQEIGEIFSVHGEYLQDWLLYQTDYSWRLEQADGGEARAVADIGSHWLDAAEYVTGQKICRVFAKTATFYPERYRPTGEVETFSHKENSCHELFPVKTEDYAQIMLEFQNGSIGSVVVSQMFAGYKNKMTLSVAGSKEALVFDTEKLNELWIGRRDDWNRAAVKDPGLLSDSAKLCDSYPGGHVEGFADAFKHNFKQIYMAAHQECTSPEYATFQDGVHEMELCESILQSAKSSTWVDVL